MTDDVIELIDAEETLELSETRYELLELVEQGPQGVPGPVADLDTILAKVDEAVQDYFVLHPQSFVYDQTTEVYRWSILHPLDHRPEVTVTDSAGTEYEGQVSWPAPNLVYVDFNIPLAGRATLT